MLINSQTNLNKVAPTPTPNTNGNRSVSFAQNPDTVEFSTKKSPQEKSSFQKYGIPLLAVAAIATAAILTKGKLWSKKPAEVKKAADSSSTVSNVKDEAEKLAQKTQAKMYKRSQKFAMIGDIYSKKSIELQDANNPEWKKYNEKAIRAFGKAIEYDRQNPKILCQRGSLFDELDETKKAELHYREAIRIAPNYPTAYFNMANLLGTKQPEAAFYYLNRGSQLAPLDGDFDRLKADLIKKLKEQGKEVIVAKVAKKQPPTAKELSALKLQEKKLAQEIKKTPQKFRLYSEIADVLGKQERYDEAIKALRIATTLRPDFSDGYVALGSMYKNAKLYPQAIESYNRAIALNPMHSVAHYNKCGVYIDMGKPHSALDSINEAIRINPNDQDSGFIRTFLLDGMGKTEDCSADILTQKRLIGK